MRVHACVSAGRLTIGPARRLQTSAQPFSNRPLAAAQQTLSSSRHLFRLAIQAI